MELNENLKIANNELTHLKGKYRSIISNFSENQHRSTLNWRCSNLSCEEMSIESYDTAKVCYQKFKNKNYFIQEAKCSGEPTDVDEFFGKKLSLRPDIFLSKHKQRLTTQHCSKRKFCVFELMRANWNFRLYKKKTLKK